MRNIYLVRHGESVANLDRAIYGTTPDHAIGLSPRGHDQAVAAGEALAELLADQAHEPVRIWTSPYLRTRQTASHIEAALEGRFARLDKREHINLCEQQFGLFDGVPDAELPQRFPDEHRHYTLAASYEGKFWARMPLGESRFDVAVRVHQAFGTFHRDAERRGIRNIVVVCHGVTLRAFAMQWLHLPYEWFEKQPNPGNCDILHIDRHNDGRYVFEDGRLVNAPRPVGEPAEPTVAVPAARRGHIRYEGAGKAHAADSRWSAAV